MIKAFIFDLDGTLLDTLSTITYYVNKTLQSEGFSPITEDECRYFVGNGPEMLIRRALISRGCSDGEYALELLGKYKSNYDVSPLYLTAPFPGIEELLSALSERGILIGVVSNKQEKAVIEVVSHFFGDKVDAVRGSREGVPLKPAPDAIYEMMSELGVTADEVVYVGDTDVDMKTGRAFGATRTVGVLWGFRDKAELLENGADAIVSSPSELVSEALV